MRCNFNRLFKVIPDFSKQQMEKPSQSLEQWDYNQIPKKKERISGKRFLLTGYLKTKIANLEY